MHVNILGILLQLLAGLILHWGIPASGLLFKYVANISLLSAIYFCNLSTFKSLRVYLYDLIELLNFLLSLRNAGCIGLSDCFPVWYARTNVHTRRGLGPTTDVQVQLYSTTNLSHWVLSPARFSLILPYPIILHNLRTDHLNGLDMLYLVSLSRFRFLLFSAAAAAELLLHFHTSYM